jgi:hypothetical protein
MTRNENQNLCYYNVRYEDNKAEFKWVDGFVSIPEQPKGFKRARYVPALLLACYESYDIASPYYERLFSTLGYLIEIYFSPDLDILHITRTFLWEK